MHKKLRDAFCLKSHSSLFTYLLCILIESKEILYGENDLDIVLKQLIKQRHDLYIAQKEKDIFKNTN